jgi:predicted amidohydrolase
MDALSAAVIQLNCQSDVSENLAQARTLTRSAAAAGARLVVLPENFAFMGEEDDKRRIAEDLTGSGPMTSFLRETAKESAVFLVGGGMPEQSADPARPYNTSVLVSPSGEIVASYRKVHLFDVDLPDGTEAKESRATHAGDTSLRVQDVFGVKLGMTICYDLRFPEEYRALVDLGARIVTVPAAFTLMTGKDHWHTLLRARAIENQVFVLAAAQHGKHPRGRTTYGKSLIVDPWGTVLAQVGEGVGYALARLDFDYQDKVRAGLPCLAHRRMK